MALQLQDESPEGQWLSDRNRLRQYDYLTSCYAISGYGLEIDHDFICSLNFYATQYLSPQAGRYRRFYEVRVQNHHGADWPVVLHQMERFLEVLHTDWAAMSEMEAAAYALWGVNNVHPFCDGNGRTARALCYYVLCKKVGMWLRGNDSIMEMIRTHERDRYCDILQRMHDARTDEMRTDLGEMASFLNDLVLRQLRTASP
jgi:Fic family protein